MLLPCKMMNRAIMVVSILLGALLLFSVVLPTHGGIEHMQSRKTQDQGQKRRETEAAQGEFSVSMAGSDVQVPPAGSCPALHLTEMTVRLFSAPLSSLHVFGVQQWVLTSSCLYFKQTQHLYWNNSALAWRPPRTIYCGSRQPIQQ